MEEQNVKVLLLNIKTNIAKFESGVADNQTLKDIESDFLNILELVKLFLISKRDTYYGYFMMNMKFKVDFKSDTIAGIFLNEYPPVFVSNPLILCKWTLQEIIYVICHEIEHVILNHPAEMVKCNPKKDPDIFKKFNLAADASVNDRLDDEILHGFKFMATPSCIINSKTLASIFALKNVQKLQNYIYYYNLIKDIETDKDQSDVMSEEMNNDSGSGDNSSQDKSNGSSQNDDSSTDKSEESSESDGEKSGNEGGSNQDDGIVSSKNFKGTGDHNWGVNEDEYDDVFANTKEFINKSYSMINEKNRGMMPANFVSEVQRINEPPKINWQSLLKKYIGTISADRIHTRTRLNRRQPNRFDLSGKINDKTLKLVVAIDTSGSVSDEEVTRIFNEIFSILAKRKYTITVIECDSLIQRVYTVKKPSDVKNDVLGRGGTSFIPVIKYINKEKKFRDALLIYFTDGYGDNKIPKPLTYRNIWVITQGDKDCLSLENPYGIVVAMENK